ncbi:MAG: hypothetical protein IT239_03445, partial [Bacteroidia bacterium]|nr:hypothetical protein [Bacteroidia bacterium]
MKKLLFTLSVFLGVLNTINAQTDFKYCGFTEKYLTRLKTNPGIIQEQQNLENFTRSFELQKLTQKEQQTGPYIIPIVFHIIHQYGSENISDAQVLDEVRILNLDFRKLNADTTAIVPEFKGIAADANIEFRLAQKDPNGNCTNGIDRIASVQTNIGDDGSKLNPWDRKKYLNVWVVKTISSGAAGYAYYPSSVNGSPSIDGIIILSSYIGSVGTGNAVTSRALSHEIGHYLNLPHVWGDTNQPGVACGDDGVADTPVTKGYTSCTLNNAISCTPGVVENIQNYMEYAYCQNMFTAGQAIRMQAALNSSISGRSTLWSATNLTATGVDNVNPSVCSPKADFTPGNYTVICQGSAITFKEVSSNG